MAQGERLSREFDVGLRLAPAKATFAFRATVTIVAEQV
jgi:hypothetical protein